MSSQVRCIFVGVENRGAHILKLFGDESDRFVAVALVDRTAEIAQNQRDALGLKDAICTDSLPRAITAVEADACVITSPARFHGRQIRTALEAGLHVYVAKPITYDFDEAVDLVRLAESKKLCLLVDQQQRHSPTERRLRRLVADQTYGPLGHVAFTIHRYRPQMRSFTGSDPFIWEQGVHSFNSLIAILNRRPLSVSAMQASPPWSAYNDSTTAMGVILFEGNVLCNYLGTFESINHTMEIRLDFQRAAVRAVAENSWNKRLEIAEPGGDFAPADLDDNAQQGPLEQANIDAFYAGVTEGGRVVNDGRDNLQTLAVIDAFIRSSKSGQSVEVRRIP